MFGNTGFGANKPAGGGFGFGATNAQPLGGGFGAAGNTAFNKPATTFGSPAGGTGFGAPAAGGFGGNAGGGFGGTSAFGSSPSTGFGSAKPAFGTSNTVTNNLSGLGGGLGGGGGWGAGNTGNTLGGGLGTASTFGGGNTGFGGGNTLGAAPAFGQAAGGSPFGAKANTIGAGFGGGGLGGGNTLGGNTGGAFGGLGGATSSFGNTAGGAFGGGGNAFGAPAAATPAFGGGLGGGLGGGAFGQQQTQPAAGGFGFGATAAPAFGAAPAGNAFGGGGLGGGMGAFGSPQGQQQQGGTGNPPFRPHTVTETMVKNGHQQSTQCNIQVITAMQAYQNKSVEELRFEDYSRGNKGPGQGGAGLGGQTSTLGNLGGGLGGGGMFGGAAAGTSPFGAKPAGTLGGFGGAPAASGFGSTGFGSPAGATSAFGAPAGGNAFGAPAGQTSAFGAPAGGMGAFGAPAGGASAFGAPAGGTSAFGAPSGGLGAFGAATNNTGAGGFGGFGSTAGQGTTSAFGAAPAAGGAFGAPAAGGLGSFGQAAGGAFGQAPAGGNAFGGFGAAAAKPATSGFGSLGGTTGGFGSTTLGGGGGFGAPAASTGFGSPAGGAGGFGSTQLGATNAFGAAPSAGGFGAPAASTPAGGGFGGFGSPLGGGFGSTAGASTLGGFGAAKPATSFGAPATTPSTSFGAPAAGGGFGGMGGFGGFGAPASTPGAGSLGGFGQTTPSAGGGFGGGFGQPAQQFTTQQMQGGAPMSNLQQQQQLLLQVASLQQQQQQQDVADRIEMLRRKKEELTQTGTVVVSEPLNDNKTAPNLFSGFVGAKAQVPAYYKTSPRSSARVMPRGVRGFASPAPSQAPPQTGQVSNTPLSASSAAGTPYRNDNLLSPEPYSLGRNAKKLIVSSFKSPLPDPTEDLPPVPSSSSHTPQQTPHRMDVSSTVARSGAAGESSNRRNGATNSVDTTDAKKNRAGEATGLTPAHTATPYYARHNDQDSGSDDATNFASPVPYRLTPKDNTRTSLGRTPRPVSPDPEDEPNSTAAPVLTRAGYFTCPDISVLQKYSSKELSKVRQFTVFRPNFGKIEWIGETDVRNLDLDHIVKIEKKEVFVYEDVTPVAEGEELNKPAVVTLHNVFPKEGSTEKKKAEFYRKLQDFCESNEADFISYDRNTGDWVFGVKHFSRYGIADSDDEDEEPRQAVEMQDTTAQEVKTANPFDVPATGLAAHNIQKLRSMLTTTNAPRNRVVDLSPQRATPGSDYYSSVIGTAEKRSARMLLVDTPDELENGTDSPPLTKRRIDDMLRVGAFGGLGSPVPGPTPGSARVDKSLLLTVEQVRLASKPAKTYVSESFASYQAFHLAEDSPCMKIMMQVKARAAQATGSIVDTSAAAYTQAGLRKETASVSTLQKGITNYALSMGRSFRVGWSKDGKIVHAGKFTFSGANVAEAVPAVGSVHRVLVEKVDTMRWARNYKPDADFRSAAPETILEDPLVAMLTASHQAVQAKSLSEAEAAAQISVSASLGKLPLWQLPAADPSQLHEYIPFLTMLKSSIAAYQAHAPHHRHPDWTVGKALELIDATYGQEKTTFSADAATRAMELIPLYEDRQQYAPEIWERRRTMLSCWIESVTSTQVKQTDEADNGQFGQSAKTYNRMFELLSCRRLNDAVSLAEKAGMFRLATLLSQLDGDATIPTLIRNQLAMWKVSEADLTIAPELVKLYRLLAGTVITEDADGTTESSMLGLGWLRGIGVLFWYCSSTDSFIENVSTLSSSLENYRIVLQDSVVDAPVSPYLQDKDAQGADVSYPNTVHGLYALLELLFPSAAATNMDLGEAELEMDIRNNVIAAVKPNGYTRDALDHRASFLLLVMLESAGISHINAAHACIIRQHYIFQLLSAGLWQWALFVALQIPDLSARYCIVSDIVLRFGGECDWEEEKRASKGGHAYPSLYAFLTTALNVPEALLHEASAYRAGYSHQHNQQVRSLISAGRYRLATEVTVTHLAPTAMLASGAAAEQLLQLLESITDLAHTESCEQSYRSAYADHWTDLSTVFLPFLRLKRDIALLGDAHASSPSEEMRAALEVPDVLREARQLFERLTTLHQQRTTHLLRGNSKTTDKGEGVSVVTSEQKLIQVVLFDMGTYLYSLLQRLEMTNFSNEDDAPTTVESSHLHVQSLLTREHMDLAPVLNEKLANTASRCNSEFLQCAANRLVLAQQ